MAKKHDESIDRLDKKRKDSYIQKARECSFFLSSKYRVKKVYVIGSLVKGIFHDRSDIDLVVEGLPAEQYIKALTELYEIIPPGVELNLIPFEDAFASLKRKAVAEGQLLYG